MSVKKTRDGFVPTPARLVDAMVTSLFDGRKPRGTDVLLDPGCGEGCFISGVERYCERSNLPLPNIIGVELDAERARSARCAFSRLPQVQIIAADFLRTDLLPQADFIIGNPPYVSLNHIAKQDRYEFRKKFRVARGRFDLYMLFIEQSILLLRDKGRLALVTPEKWLYVQSARRLREYIAEQTLVRLEFVDENSFPSFVTYPLITVLQKGRNEPLNTKVKQRDGSAVDCYLERDPERWPALRGNSFCLGEETNTTKLTEICDKIGCGPATGLDSAFLAKRSELDSDLLRFAHPTISGKQLNGRTTPIATDAFLMPYDRSGKLIPEDRLGALAKWLLPKRAALETRSCAARKPWYAYHETPAMNYLLQPKILCRDITDDPKFYEDMHGSIIPRHSVYYIVPKPNISIRTVCKELNKTQSIDWLRGHAQRAANGYVRIQSALLKKLPIDERRVSEK